ncbi:two pore domain potassium channel family protein [Pseudonocardia sp. C8]|uniref:potassium channel family protein n=1 Tax=Pseudonocardia sp. C8 TaxID=2762759 RepID=UPI0016430ABA|nr:potassium channel family protein [Pseudonocardia sp. C8]MBC3192143.1 two pore domain potassium channel family protein [Pseudonocardia sp. C8]
MGTTADGTDPESRLRAWERRTDLPLTVLSVGFLVLYAVEVLATAPGSATWHGIEVVLWLVWAVFVVDVVIRFVLARDRRRFVLDNPLDVLVVLAPFLRFLRLVRLLSAVSVLTRTLRDDLRGRVSTYLVVTVSLLGFVAALGVYEAERHAPEATITSFGDSLWWVLTTITTVGYGDRYPVTVEGRLVAAGLMLAGIAVLGTVTATIATWFTQQIEESRAAAEAAEAAAGRAGPPRSPEPETWDAVLEELRRLRERLDELEDRPRP